MSTKRRPGNDLNHDNWDDEVEQEEQGEFRRASEEELKRRPIRVAKRRVVASTTSDETDADAKPSAASAFSGFSAFGKLAETASPSPFSFLSTAAAGAASAKPVSTSAATAPSPFASLSSSSSLGSNGASQKTISLSSGPNSSSSSSTNGNSNSNSSNGSANVIQVDSSSTASQPAQSASKTGSFYAQLVGLNRSVSAWIAKHIDRNPACMLTPIFDDYARHLEKIKQSPDWPTTSKSTDSAASSSAAKATFNFAASDNKPAAKSDDALAKATFSFGSSAATSKSDSLAKASFAFGAKTDSDAVKSSPQKSEPAKAAFSFGSSAASPPEAKKADDSAPRATFSFGAVSSPPDAKKSSDTSAVKTTFSFGAATSPPEAKPVEPAAKAAFSFGAKPAGEESTKPAFSFGLAKAATDDAPKEAPKFSFGGGASAAPSTGFSFGGTKSSIASAFANIKSPEDHAREAAAKGQSTETTAADDENEEPPKNEFTPVVEEDALHTQRCKVYVKSGPDYVDRGVGNLFIKSAQGGEKTQLLVRADTNLGNILLNILLTDAVPASRMGKNNVMMVCVPTPDSKPPPVTVLVRVKNGEEADDLLAQINKHKK